MTDVPPPIPLEVDPLDPRHFRRRRKNRTTRTTVRDSSTTTENPAGEPAETLIGIEQSSTAGDPAATARALADEGGTIPEPEPIPREELERRGRETVELLETALLAWNMLASKRAPRWVFDDEERETLAAVWAPVLDKWLPHFDLGPELVAVVATIPIVLARIRPEPDAPSSSAALLDERLVRGYGIE